MENEYLDSKGRLLSSRRDEFLELRYNPTLSIVAAAEYDKRMFDSVVGSTSKNPTEVDRIFFARHPGRDFTKQRLGSGQDEEFIQEWKQISNAQPGRSLVPKNLTLDQKARYLYLCHHEGGDGAIRFLDGSLTDAHAKYLLELNVEDESLDVLIKKYGSPSKAYIGWLWSYIDRYIQPSGFRA